jgi:competence protein ComEC
MKKLITVVSITILLITALLALSCSNKTTPVTTSQSTTVTTPIVTTTTSTFTTTTATGKLDVYFIDVGQGDSILIDQGSTEILIDAGESSPRVTSFLQQYVDGPLEVMVATHAHADHIGGLTAVLNAFEVEQIWHSGDTSTSKTYATFMAAVNSEGADVYIGKRGDTITAGNLSFTVLSPVSPDSTSNNNSLVLWLSYGDIDFLFTGDAEQEAEANMLAAGLLSDIDILKVGHHGSRTASSPAFLSVVKPELAIYMAKIGNTYGHPHQETLTSLNNIGAMIYGTDVNGNIVVETDGNTYNIQIEKTGTPKAGS